MAQKRKIYGSNIPFIQSFLLAIILFIATLIYPFINALLLNNRIFNQCLSFRRIKDTPSVIKTGEIEPLLKRFISKIKVVVFDMDGTISNHPVNPADPEVIRQIIELTKAGIHVAIVSGAYAGRIEKVLFDNFPDDFKGQEFIHIYGYGGTKGYPLGKDNKVNTSKPYYECALTENQQRIIDEVIEDFKKKYGEDFDTAINHGSKTTIRLWHIERSDEVIEKYVRFLRTELDRRGALDLIVNAGGTNWGIDILVADKSIAIKDLISRIPGISAENIMVVADSFSGLAGNDKSMALPGVLVFNIGEHQSVPSGIYSLEKKGPAGTMELMAVFLDLLNKAD